MRAGIVFAARGGSVKVQGLLNFTSPVVRCVDGGEFSLLRGESTVRKPFVVSVLSGRRVAGGKVNELWWSGRGVSRRYCLVLRLRDQ